ncbi:hypothetical protein [Fusobacterium sp. PH5-44]|uniref:hypothetical protein n=1 Tax=unclassified Fusobacterium TaxID=2648384 RepID=UPI003D1AEA5E
MKERFEEYYPDGTLKRTGYKNKLGNIDGFVIIYNEDGTEKEKLKYDNGMRLGNVLMGLSSEEIIQKLIVEGEAIDINEIGQDELYDEGDDVSLAKASTLLTAKKYYE